MAHIASQMASNTTPEATTPSPQPNSFLIPTLPPGLGGGSQTRNASARQVVNGSVTASGQRVQLGPGQDVGSLAEDITSGRYMASDLDK